MYTAFYNLKAKPFSLTPDPGFYFSSRGHRKALTYLNYAVLEASGFVVVTGEVGAGKTTLLRIAMKGLKDKGVLTAFIKNTMVTSRQLVRLIADDFGVEGVWSMEKDQVISAFNRFLVDGFAKNRKCILIIDEAQNLTPRLLEEVRLLSNLETDSHKLLQIILCGQPELRDRLALPGLRQLRQRICLSYHLGPLTREETQEYVRHRIGVAGGSGIFRDDACDEIFDFSGGVPRLINILCDFCLLCGFVEEKKEIDRETVRAVRKDIEADAIKESNRSAALNGPYQAEDGLEELEVLEELDVQEGLLSVPDIGSKKL